jgi:uncharacterized protein YjbI with pentapeptide repeats
VAAERIQAPDLPRALERRSIEDGDVELSGALVEAGTVRAGRIRITESELRGLVLETQAARGLTLVDVVLRDCGLANVDGREGTIRRVTAGQCRLVGIDLAGSDITDLRVSDSSLELASFAGARLRDTVFERVNLGEASFQEARLDHVTFIDCELAGADFHRARTAGCLVRGVSLDGVTGLDGLRGVRMPWTDVLASAAALAGALGIEIAEDGVG